MVCFSSPEDMRQRHIHTRRRVLNGDLTACTVDIGGKINRKVHQGVGKEELGSLSMRQARHTHRVVRPRAYHIRVIQRHGERLTWHRRMQRVDLPALSRTT